MLLSHCSQSDSVVKADVLRKFIEESQPAGLVVTVNIGVAELVVGGDLDSLFIRADMAVYQAKDGGRNRVEQYIEGESKIKNQR